MLDAAMTVHEPWLGNLRRGWRISLVTGHLQPVRDRALQACGSKVFLCFEVIVYKICMHLSEIYASPESMEFAADFVWLSTGAKPLKIGGYKLTDRAGIYFWGQVAEGRGGEGNVTFRGVQTKSAHINGTDGDIRVYTFVGLQC